MYICLGVRNERWRWAGAVEVSVLILLPHWGFISAYLPSHNPACSESVCTDILWPPELFISFWMRKRETTTISINQQKSKSNTSIFFFRCRPFYSKSLSFHVYLFSAGKCIKNFGTLPRSFYASITHPSPDSVPDWPSLMEWYSWYLYASTTPPLSCCHAISFVIVVSLWSTRGYSVQWDRLALTRK